MAEEKKLFGMPAEKGRWILIVLGFIINICLGSVYAYSVFGKQLASRPEWNFWHPKLLADGVTQATDAAGNLLWYQTNTDILKQQIPFGVFLLFFALIFPFAGQILEKWGPRKQGIIGGIIVAAGWIAASFVARMGSHPIYLFVLAYGVIGGIGVGLCYIAPIQVATRWFPDRKGLATGLTVAGFGGSPFISTYLAQKLINWHGHVADALLWLGVAFLVVLIISFLFMAFPQAGWTPAGWKPKAAAPAAATSAVNYNRNEIIKTGAFWILFICFTIGSLAGLMAIGIYSSVMTLKPMIAIGLTATVVQFILAPFNALGRPVLGWVTDRTGPKVAAMVTFVLILLAAIGMIIVKTSDAESDLNKALYFICFAAFYAGLGGWLAIAPTATAQYFGAKFSSRNYGILFLAYGVGGLIATFVAAYSKSIFGGDQALLSAFIPVAILAGVGLILAALFMKPPKPAAGPKT